MLEVGVLAELDPLGLQNSSETGTLRPILREGRGHLQTKALTALIFALTIPPGLCTCPGGGRVRVSTLEAWEMLTT